MAAVGAMVLVRAGLDLVALSSGPFALIYPTIVLATLYGHWRGGVTAYILALGWSWYAVLPERFSFVFADPADASRTAINAVSALVVLIVPEAFRAAAQRYRMESERALARRLVLLAELEHRTKNNFALVAGMLEIHRRQVAAPEAQHALDDAIARVRTFASAYSNLANEQHEGAEVAMKPFLEQLAARVSRASFPDTVEIDTRISALTLPRETGVAIGLYLNEALLNCAKYAFPDAAVGSIQIVFEDAPSGWRLLVEDSGGSSAASSAESGGLGSRLMAAFAQQAHAIHTVRPSVLGYSVELTST